MAIRSWGRKYQQVEESDYGFSTESADAPLKEESDADLKVKERFARIVASGSLMESNKIICR